MFVYESYFIALAPMLTMDVFGQRPCHLSGRSHAELRRYCPLVLFAPRLGKPHELAELGKSGLLICVLLFLQSVRAFPVQIKDKHCCRLREALRLQDPQQLERSNEVCTTCLRVSRQSGRRSNSGTA